MDVYLIFNINLSIDANLDAISLRTKVEEAMNIACHYLEENTQHNYISYNIRHIMDCT